jgi:hypothetical protein
MPTRAEVYKAIDSEREYQEKRWNANTTTSEGFHEVGAWLTFMRDYLREAETQISRNADPEASAMAIETIRKIAGMTVAAMEQHGAPLRK